MGNQQPSGVQPSQTTQTIHDLQDTQETLDKTLEKINKDIEEQDQLARKWVREGNKTNAAMALKRKKALQARYEKINTQKMNLEHMEGKVGEAAVDMEVLKAQQKAAKALKNAYEGKTVEDIEATMMDIQDTIQDHEEISNALAQPLGTTLDDDDVLNELDALKDELNEEQMTDLKPVSKRKISTTKVTKPAKVEEDVDEDMKALEAELA